jgi:ribonuclease P protein component
VLAQLNRLTSREDFQRVTKSKIRSHTKTLTGYLLTELELTEPKIGFIVAGNIGGSVRRHRVARQLREASRQSIHILPKSSLVVVRANKRDQDAKVEIPELFSSLSKKVSA